ncbi:MAG: FxLYD domain-containing protein [Mucilaginibacter sp.]
MKTLTTTIFAALLCLFYSCKQADRSTAKRSAADSLEIQAKATQLAQQMMQRAKDSLAKAKPVATTHKVKSYGPCPAVVKKCSVVNDVRGTKAILVTLKNNSGKRIDAVRIAWVVYNKQDKRIGGSSGMAKKELPKGKSTSYSWDINAPSGTHAKASVTTIHYKDGSVWKSDADLM